MTWTDSAISLAETLAAQVALIAFLFGIEQFRPARPQGISCLRLNIAYVAALRIIYAVLYPLSLGLTTLTVNALGGGLIELPASGAGLAVAIPCYALAMHGGEYLFHRVQDRIPLLWAMHSLHHSDPAVNASTAPRHFWGEMLLKSVTIYTLIGLVFKTNAVVVAAYAFFGLYNHVQHMNLRLGFARRQPLLNSPQFHRLHQSALPEHHNRNFNQFLFVFDVLLGNCCRPKHDEYPPTGAVDGDVRLKLFNMLLWPWRQPRAVSMSIPNA